MFTIGLGFPLGGRELVIGLFGSLPITLLLTNMLAKVWFLFGATIGVSVNICFRKLSWFREGQFDVKISLASLHNGPYLIGNTIGALSLSLSEFDMNVFLLVNGYSRKIESIDFEL